MSERTRISQRSKVSHTPFATVGKNGKCPSCGWEPDGGGLFGRGITMALRIHCYRKHGLRLVAGVRSRLPSDTTTPIDLDAEFTAHLWVIELAVRNWCVRPRDEVMQEACWALLSAILQWDKRKNKSFRTFATPLIHQRAGKAAKKAQQDSLCQGTPLRVMLSPPPDEAPATCDEIAKASLLLTDAQRKVLGMRFCEKPATFDEIGESMGVSKERVRQIEMSALRRLHKELTGEENGPRGAKRKPRRKPKPRKKKGLGLPVRGRFAILWDSVPTEMDKFNTLRLTGSVSVFTDRSIAARLAENLKARLAAAGKPATVTIVDHVGTSGMKEVLVDGFESGTRRSMTVAAIHGELEEHGAMTTAQIASRLMKRADYISARYPRPRRNMESTVLQSVMNCIGSVKSVRKSGDIRPVYSLP